MTEPNVFPIPYDSARNVEARARDRRLFELDFEPAWDLDERFFLDVEHRYAKSHWLLRDAVGDLSGRRIRDLGCSRGMLLERFRRYNDVKLLAIELDPPTPAGSTPKLSRSRR